MELDFMNTPMSGARRIRKCQFCKTEGNEKNSCTLAKKANYYAYSCNYLQELICPRALKAQGQQKETVMKRLDEIAGDIAKKANVGHSHSYRMAPRF